MILLENKKAVFDYEILEKFEAGIQLLGFEVKSLKMKQGSLAGGRVAIRNNEAFIVGMQIPPYQPKNISADYDPYRTRKLLLRKSEIDFIEGKSSQKGLTAVPLNVYTKDGFIKISFCLARGLKKYDKRHIIKQREAKRDIERKIKGATE